MKLYGGRFPRDEEFRAAFVVKDVYNFRSRNYLLRKLENYGQKELVNVESCTIEHIMPQNEQLSAEWQEELGPNWQEVHAKYLHTIGNLTLTGYNSELSDRPFREKRYMEGGFAHSPIRLNRSLSTLEHWNNEEIEKRAQALADIAVNAWSMPQLSPEQISKYSRKTQRLPLAEVIGPFEHPMAGFIPEGFKVVQILERKFHYYRLVGDEWIQYGNGKDAWYAISWNTVGWRTRDLYKNGTMPLGVGGEINQRFRPEIMAQYPDIEEGNGNDGYTLQDYPGLQGDMREVFEQLRKRILNLDVTVREEYKKMYIAYKTTTNFVDIEPQIKRLSLFLHMKFSEINDPKGLCKDLTGKGHYTNGDVEISVTSLDHIEDVMDLVRQSFERHWEEVYA
jgi:predicted transport protein